LPSITGAFVKSVNLTGWAFSGGSKLLGFPVVDFVEEVGSAVASGAVNCSGVGEAEGLVAGGVSLLSADDVVDRDDWVDGVEDADWARASGGKRTRMADTNKRGFTLWRVSRVSRNQSPDLH
jgi:hypothetical protein